jgi:hypothetical protein
MNWSTCRKRGKDSSTGPHWASPKKKGMHNIILSNKRKHVNSPDEMKGLTFGALIRKVSKLQYKSTLHYAYDQLSEAKEDAWTREVKQRQACCPLVPGWRMASQPSALSVRSTPATNTQHTHPISILLRDETVGRRRLWCGWSSRWRRAQAGTAAGHVPTLGLEAPRIPTERLLF